MLTRKELADARERAARIFAATGIALTDAERAAIEIADFGLSKLEETGLEIVVYVNTERVAAKELAMFPRQICPEHRHPPFDGTPGKEETFRCRAGTVYVYTEGEPAAHPHARVPADGGRPGYLQRSKDRAGHPAGRRMTLDPPSSCWHRFLPNQDEARLTTGHDDPADQALALRWSPESPH